MAGAHGIREGAAKKYPISGIFVFGRCQFQACRAHQERGDDLAGTPGGWGFSDSPALQRVSLLGSGRQPHVGKVAKVLQALKFFGHHGDQDVLEEGFEPYRLVFGKVFHGAGTRTGTGHVLRVDADPVQAAMYVAIQVFAALEQHGALRCFLVVPVHLPGLAIIEQFDFWEGCVGGCFAHFLLSINSLRGAFCRIASGGPMKGVSG